jgi:hypothetical protein
MAKKVVATLKKADAGVKSEKTGSYTFREEIVPADQVQEALKSSR